MTGRPQQATAPAHNPIQIGPVAIRTMIEADLDPVATIESMANPEPWSRSLLAGELRQPADSTLWLVATDESDGSVVGYGGTVIVADDAHILSLAVHPDRRRQGIAGLLLCRLLTGAVDRGATAATLEVRAGNRPAIALYSQSGFRKSGRRRGYYQDGSDALILWRPGLQAGFGGRS